MIKCKICGIEMTHILTLNKHVKNEHDLTVENYILKTEYNDIHPLCKCGCGEKLKMKKRKFRDFISAAHYNKFIVSDPNSNHLKKKKSNKLLSTLKEKKENRNFELDLNKLNTSVNEMIEYYNKYCNFDISMMNISKKLCLDKRTILKWWDDMKLIENKDNFKRICKKHQRKWVGESNITKINDDILYNVYTFLKSNKNKFTISHVRQKFEIKESKLLLYKQLIEFFGKDEIDEFINLKNSSKPEMDFYYILRYYFGEKNIKSQFKLKNKFFDFKLGDNILIEYDGDYWHSKSNHIENDKIKTKLAIDNGYILVRIKDSESKDIEILNKIYKLWKGK